MITQNGETSLIGVGSVEIVVRDIDTGQPKVVRFRKAAKKLLNFTDGMDSYSIPIDYYLISDKTKIKVAEIWEKKITELVNKFGQKRKISLIGLSDTAEYGTTSDIFKWYEKNYIVSAI